MSKESQEVFDAAVLGYQAGQADAEALRAAAVGHLGASRSLEVLTVEYAAALAAGDHALAQRLADELAPVRAAQRAAAGIVPRAG